MWAAASCSSCQLLPVNGDMDAVHWCVNGTRGSHLCSALLCSALLCSCPFPARRWSSRPGPGLAPCPWRSMDGYMLWDCLRFGFGHVQADRRWRGGTLGLFACHLEVEEEGLFASPTEPCQPMRRQASHRVARTARSVEMSGERLIDVLMIGAGCGSAPPSARRLHGALKEPLRC